MNVYLNLSAVVLYCGVTLVLFTADQKNTIYKGYIDILKVLMFLQSYSWFFYSLFSYLDFSRVFWKGFDKKKRNITHLHKR